jgi:restriction system protein
VILIDGKKLADLMYDFGVGVQLKGSYEIKDIDEDFFNGDGTL